MAEDIYITLKERTESGDISWYRLLEVTLENNSLSDFIREERQRFKKGTISLFPVGTEYLEAYLMPEKSYYCPFYMGYIYLFRYILPGTDRDYVVLAVQDSQYASVVALNNEFCMVEEAKDLYETVVAQKSSNADAFIEKIMELGEDS